MVSDIMQVNQVLSLPIEVVKLLWDAFMCKICHVTPMKPTLIATKCCSSLLGCEECFNAWYEGVDRLSKKCPYCNEPRGYAFTFQFKGMGEFLVGVRDLLNCGKIAPTINLIQRCTFVVLTSCLYFYPNCYSSLNYCSFSLSSEIVYPLYPYIPVK